MKKTNAIGSGDKRHFFKTGFRGAPGTFELNDEQLKRLQQTLIEMLKDFVEVFEQEKIFYTLSGGSVLGAIRHGGFIPWDDDIDINMPRKDFEHLKKVFDEKLSDKYVLCGPEFGRGYGMSHVQIKKKGTTYKAFNELTMEDTGIFIDIFVLENTYDNHFKRKIHGYWCLMLGYILTCRKTAQDWEALEPYLSVNEGLKAAFSKKMKIGRLFKWMSLDKVAKRVIYWYSYCDLEESEMVCIPSGRKHYFGEMYKREDMCKSREATFEGMTVRIPKGTETYMKVLYGPDYMQIPPVEDREIHSAVALDFGK
ncbi:phosphorylcholine transferase LicD [Butyrivibrio sp. JL13D10]|uniref:LicD family protein n=1 Tax=Butyrivibrio sp. JL13D10 TaxID=3236815 RepID=UPI0038B45FC0